jgi:hypothetical protein
VLNPDRAEVDDEVLSTSGCDCNLLAFVLSIDFFKTLSIIIAL